MDGTFSIISTAILLMFVLDPFGNVPLVLALLKDFDDKKRYRIIAREVLIGLLILLIFLFFGNAFLSLFHLDTEAVTIAGGVIFFIIGLRLIFPGAKGSSLYAADGEPLIVPIALPMIAGPSALATLLVMSKTYKDHTMGLFLALLLAWTITAIIMLSAPALYRVLRKRGVIAMERLMGMLLLIMAVQMFLDGFKSVVESLMQ
jgi:multiple antibiotic resistance protein